MPEELILSNYEGFADSRAAQTRAEQLERYGFQTWVYYDGSCWIVEYRNPKEEQS